MHVAELKKPVSSWSFSLICPHFKDIKHNNLFRIFPINIYCCLSDDKLHFFYIIILSSNKQLFFLQSKYKMFKSVPVIHNVSHGSIDIVTAISMLLVLITLVCEYSIHVSGKFGVT